MIRRVATWCSSPALPVYFFPLDLRPQPVPVAGSLRQHLRISVGGAQPRLTFSNALGTTPLTIGGASVTLGNGSTPVRVLFDGQPHLILADGASALSDPLDMVLAPLSELTLCVYLPQAHVPGMGSHQNDYWPDHDGVMQTDWPTTAVLPTRSLVTCISVQPDVAQSVVVALGDSLTDGHVGARRGTRSWADVLAARLQARDGQGPSYAVVNAGIGGNRLTGTFVGPSALSRLERDVLAVPGVTHLVLFEGINDLGVGGRTVQGTPYPLVSAQEIIAIQRQIVTRAREQGLVVIGATLMPFRDAFFFTEDKEVERLKVNRWIRESGAFDGVLDFEAVVRDPNAPSRVRAEFDSGDHLHPNEAAHVAMGQAIELNLFAPPDPSSPGRTTR